VGPVPFLKEVGMNRAPPWLLVETSSEMDRGGAMTPTAEMSRLTEPVTSSDHIRGPKDAPVTIVEYGEFECVYCGRAYHAIQRVLEQAPDVRFVFRHFARDEVHPFSERSAQAAEAAGAQGRFWEMHDFLFERQHQLEYDDLVRHAGELGLDVTRFERELVDRVHLDTVDRHRDSGISSGVDETPALFINGERYTGPYGTDSLLTAVGRG
jgi:protein-disulfide isomerase